ncbi:hypothetical protein C0995_009701 [Termitomyces sp. Mi166|nr:hypothetical protein C0995_009701 [Termitomyces sp. Mi166\
MNAFKKIKDLALFLSLQFIANHLKLKEEDLMGLVKCKAYHAVARKITEEVDAEQLIDELNKALWRQSSKVPLALPLRNTICKKHLIVLLKATEAERQQCNWLSWAMLPNHLINISHMMIRWPPSCAMPNETSKPEKNKQGIKDLGSKDGCLLLTALQSSQLKIVKANSAKIKKDKLPSSLLLSPQYMMPPPSILVPSLPVAKHGLARLPPPISAAATHVMHKKTAIIEIKRHSTVEIKSDSNDSSPHTQNPPSLQVLKKCVAIVPSKSEKDDDTKKQCQVSLSDDPVGSGDDYVHEQDNESGGGIVSLISKTHCLCATKGRRNHAKAMVKEDAKDTIKAQTTTTKLPKPTAPSKLTATMTAPPKPVVMALSKPLSAAPLKPLVQSGFLSARSSAAQPLSHPPQTPLSQVPSTSSESQAVPCLSGDLSLSTFHLSASL